MKGKSYEKKTNYKKILSFPIILKLTNNNLHKKYYINELEYGTSVINNIIYNEKTHIVAVFKDYLISDDNSEFLKRYYNRLDTSIRLPKFFEYYEKYSRIYPNYTVLNESKYIYRNIHKKQKMIDLQQKIEESEEKRKKINLNNKHKRNKEKDELVFSTDIYNSIVNNSQDLYSILFGINKNNENHQKSIEDINKIINEIEKYNIEIPNSVINSFGSGQSIIQKNNPINNINNRMARKIFNACTKQMLSISKENNNTVNYRNYKSILNDIQSLNSSANISHKKTRSCSSWNNPLNFKNQQMKLKNMTNHQSFNNIFPYSYRNKNKGEITNLMDKIKVNINSNNLRTRKNSIPDRINNKSHINLLKNNNIVNRNHNFLLNSKGILISSNINTLNKTQPIKVKNSMKKNSSDKIESYKLNHNEILSPKLKKIDNINSEKNNLKTNDFNLIRRNKFSNHNSMKNSNSPNNKMKKKIINNTNNLITSSTINTSCQNSNPIKKIKYKKKDNNSKNYCSNERNKKIINVNILNNSLSKKKYISGINIKSPSPIDKKIIQGIQIKNFGKTLRLSETISPRYENNVLLNQNKNKVNSSKNSKPKTTRINQKKKI